MKVRSTAKRSDGLEVTTVCLERLESLGCVKPRKGVEKGVIYHSMSSLSLALQATFRRWYRHCAGIGSFHGTYQSLT